MNFFEESNQATSSIRLSELHQKIKEENFQPKEYLSKIFTFENSDNEDMLIEKMLYQLEVAESDIKELEQKVEKENENLKTELEVSQMNSVIEIETFIHDFKQIKSEIRSLIEIVGIEEEKIRIVGEELLELNQTRDDKLILNELIQVLDNYIRKDNFKNKKEDSFNLLVKLDCLKTSLETLNYEEYKEVKAQISEDYIKEKDKMMNKFKSYLSSPETYPEATKMYEFIKKSGKLEEAEITYVKHLIGEQQTYGLAYKDQNIAEFSRYLYVMQRTLKQYDQKEGIFWDIHKEEGF